MYRKSTLQQNHPKSTNSTTHKALLVPTNKEIGINNIYAIYLTKGGYCVNIRILNKNDVNEFRELRLKGLKLMQLLSGLHMKEKMVLLWKI